MTLARVNIPALIAHWARIVDSVERGYTLTMDDYLNDIDARHELAKRLRKQTITVENREMLAELDQRFKDVTVESACIWGSENAADEGWTPAREWYYFRLPTDVSGMTN